MALRGADSWAELFDQTQTGSFYSNDTPAARIHRVADRIMVGDAVDYNGLAFGAGGDGSWLFDQGGALTCGWMEAGATLAAVASRGLAVMGSARNDDGTTAIGVSGLAIHNINNSSGRAWGGYFEGVLNHSSGRAKGVEIDATNLVNYNVAHTPYSDVGATMAVWVASGGDATVNPVTYPADTAIGIGNNGNTFNAGIVFQNGGLTRDGGASGRAHAIRMAYDQAIEWYEFATSALAFSIVSQVADAGHKQELRIDNNGMTLYDDNTKALFRASWVDSAVNYVNLVPSITGSGLGVNAVGDDTNISMSIRGKGTGVVNIVSGGGLILEASATASTANWLRVTSAATGGRPALSAQGETNVDLALTPKGTGRVTFGTHAAIAAETVTGYITIKDAGGTERKLAVVS